MRGRLVGRNARRDADGPVQHLTGETRQGHGPVSGSPSLAARLPPNPAALWERRVCASAHGRGSYVESDIAVKIAETRGLALAIVAIAAVAVWLRHSLGS